MDTHRKKLRQMKSEMFICCKKQAAIPSSSRRTPTFGWIEHVTRDHTQACIHNNKVMLPRGQKNLVIIALPLPPPQRLGQLPHHGLRFVRLRIPIPASLVIMIASASDPYPLLYGVVTWLQY